MGGNDISLLTLRASKTIAFIALVALASEPAVLTGTCGVSITGCTWAIVNVGRK